MFEEIRRGGLNDLADWATEGVKGEIVVVIGGAEPATVDFAAAQAEVARLVASGVRLKEACAQVAADTGHSSRELYQASLAN